VVRHRLNPAPATNPINLPARIALFGLVALAGAAFCVVTAVLYHSNFADQTQMIMFLKNFSIAGAFLMFLAHGAGAYALDKNAA